MRGEDRTIGALFSYVDIEARIPAKHPLRAMREVTNAALAELDGSFSALYERFGRPSIPPERLLRASLLQLLYSIRSERQLVERLEYDLLFRWFVGLSIDEKIFDASTFSKNRDRLLTHEIAQRFLSSLLGAPEVKGLLSAEHFSVDGTLLCQWRRDFPQKWRRKIPQSGGLWRSAVDVIGASVLGRPAATLQGRRDGIGGGIGLEAAGLGQEIGMLA